MNDSSFFAPLYVLPCTWKIPYQSFDQSVAENLFITCLMLLTHLRKIAGWHWENTKFNFGNAFNLHFHSIQEIHSEAFHLLSAHYYQSNWKDTANFNEIVHENSGLWVTICIRNFALEFGKIVCSSCFMFFTFWVFSEVPLFISSWFSENMFLFNSCSFGRKTLNISSCKQLLVAARKVSQDAQFRCHFPFTTNGSMFTEHRHL